MSAATKRISGGAPDGVPQCLTCAFRRNDFKYSGWGWCKRPENRMFSERWPEGYEPSVAPSGTCTLHPQRADASQPPGAATPKEPA